MNLPRLRVEASPVTLAVLVLAIFGIVGAAIHNHDVAEQAIGARSVALKQLHADSVRHAAVLDSLARVYKPDTVRLWRTVRSVDSIPAIVDVPRLLDSLRRAGVVRPETLKVPISLGDLARVDTLRLACPEVVRTCEARSAVLDTALGEARQTVDLVRPADGSSGLKTAGKVAGVVVVAVAIAKLLGFVHW